MFLKEFAMAFNDIANFTLDIEQQHTVSSSSVTLVTIYNSYHQNRNSLLKQIRWINQIEHFECLDLLVMTVGWRHLSYPRKRRCIINFFRGQNITWSATHGLIASLVTGLYIVIHETKYWQNSNFHKKLLYSLVKATKPTMPSKICHTLKIS
jgi:hypothetical protein